MSCILNSCVRCGQVLEPDCSIPHLDHYTLTDTQWQKMQAAPTWRGCRALAWFDRPAQAVISHYRSDIGNSQVVPSEPPLNPRFFTQRECARLQGFPETFEAQGFRFYHQIGNAVTSPIVGLIAAAIMCHLEHRAVGLVCGMSGVAQALAVVVDSTSKDDGKLQELLERVVHLPNGSNTTVESILHKKL